MAEATIALSIPVDYKLLSDYPTFSISCQLGGNMSQDTIPDAGHCDPDCRGALDQAGYAVFERLMSAELLAALRTRVAQLYAEEGDLAGTEFKLEPGIGRQRCSLSDQMCSCLAFKIQPDFAIHEFQAGTECLAGFRFETFQDRSLTFFQ